MSAACANGVFIEKVATVIVRIRTIAITDFFIVECILFSSPMALNFLRMLINLSHLS
jgi:hypothetical protein